MDSLVEIRSSPVHNRGVFAKHDIKAGQQICYYDGVIMTRKEMQDKRIPSTYAIALPDSDYACIGYENPQSPLGIAQLINDGSKPKWDFLTCPKTHPSLNRERNVLKVYTQASQMIQNVVYSKTRTLWIIAQKDIKADEELFISYGSEYWIIAESFHQSKAGNWLIDFMLCQLSEDISLKTLTYDNAKLALDLVHLPQQYQPTSQFPEEKFLFLLKLIEQKSSE